MKRKVLQKRIAGFLSNKHTLKLPVMRIIPLLFFINLFIGVYARQRPNIIYIYADDLGYGELGCYGQQKIKTPNIDKLAAEGMRFTQHYAGAPVCAPSRCMLMTGKHAGHSYIKGNYELGEFEDEKEGGQMPLPENTFTIGRLMQQSGYSTAAIGKWGLGMVNTTGNPNKQGFDYFYGYLDQKQAHNYYPTHLWKNGSWDTLVNPFIYVHKKIEPDDNNPESFSKYKGRDYAIKKISDNAVSFIEENTGKPFFLYLAFTIPHVSLQIPDEELMAYKGRFPDTPYHGDKGYTPCMYPLSTYAAMITYMDKQVGRIMSLLKEKGLDENTIIMFSSDNGATPDVGGVNTEFFNSTAGLRGRKMEVYEGGIREPFIARWKGKIKPGTTSDLISAQYDLMPTLADILHVSIPPTDGISFLPELLGNHAAQKQHPYLYFEYPENGGQLAVRMGKWKAVKSNMKTNNSAAWELYDLEADRNETNDVANKNQPIIDKVNEIVTKEHLQPQIREWEFVNPKFTK